MMHQILLFLYKGLICKRINKLLVPRGEQAGLILDEDFGSNKDHRVVEVALFKRIFWDILRQIIIPGGLG